MGIISRERLANDLKNLGLSEGNIIMMHSSLSSLGQVEGGAATVVDAILDVIGISGTLIVPAFRNSVWGDINDFAITDCCSCANRLCFSKQRGFQGAIPEEIRNRRGAVRSCHPTHSWVALGPQAEQMLAGHWHSLTPCGKGNPFEELVRLNGIILMLGVQVNTITLWHYYEEIMEVPYMGHYWPEKRFLNHCVPGLRIQYQYPGIMQDVCRIAGILKTAPVGKSVSGLMSARQFDEFMATIIADDPYCFVIRPPDRYSNNLGLDALQKAKAMLQAWAKGVHRLTSGFEYTPQPIGLPSRDDIVRSDCPAFAGLHKIDGFSVALCSANGIHPDYFRLGGVFSKYGITTCTQCSWNIKFPL